MRRVNDDGSVAILVAVVGIVLFAMSAFVVDVGGLVHEGRVLQNGADASAFAIAETCGPGNCGDPAATAAEYANANADDGASAVEELCGRLVDGAYDCSDPPDIPDGAGYVRVTTQTKTSKGGDKFLFNFARFFGLDGSTVHRRATAAWGGPSSLTAELPITISECEFNAYTNDGADLQPPPPYDAGYPSPEVTIYLHSDPDAQPCDAGPAGSDLPGGFGWLDTSGSDCYATSDTSGWFDDKTGRPPPSDCDVAEMAALWKTVVHIPIFDQMNDLNGTNGEYHMAYYASFFVTGYSIEGQYKERSVVTGSYPCSGNTSCVSGFFVDDPTPVTGDIGGASMGVLVVKLID
jgi:hypothetical protein